MVALMAALASCVTSAPQPVPELPGAPGSSGLNPELHPAIGQQDDQPHDSLPLTYASTEDKTSFEGPLDVIGPSTVGEEAGAAATKTYSDAVEVDAESGRKLYGFLPPDLAELEGPARPQVKGEAEIISEIESILGKVREQYSQNGQSFPIPEAEGESSASQGQAVKSITDLLKLSKSKIENETVEEDPVIEEARKRYMAIWNKEAERLNAPYMRVTKAWPELGMVYMPDVTEATDQIKASKAVKEAAETFKKVYEERVTEEAARNATMEPILKVLNNFMSAWIWAETTDEAEAAGLTDGDDSEEEHHEMKTPDRSNAQKRLQGNSIDSQLGELFKNMVTRRPTPNLQPSDDTKSKDLIQTLNSMKLTLSCTVVPGSLADTVPSDTPINPNIPPNNPIADIRPIIDPFGVLDSVRNTGTANTRPLIPQTPDRDRLRSPNAAPRPFYNPSVVSPLRDPIAAYNRPPVSPIAYSGPYITHEVDIRPVGFPETSAPVAARRNYNIYPITEEDDSSQPMESEEVFARLYLPQQPWREPSWLH
ncbi:uncharacterized protein LOC127006936 isoform X2 [Eriocheir sinensis]|uniref:uncharacterized protein LOC127006936 isoform X2 n=1 Tax=Eriocheir sinensis TaxID=95602 RepID=UPI0021C66707|nr:uncharacterized protein LOC127006936 isoform X2 [Eriocheir sinensis]